MGMKRWVAAGVAAAVIGGLLLRQEDRYDVQMVLPSAAQLSEGTPVWIDGRTVGEVSKIGLKDGQALVRVAIDDDAAPLHAGTRSRIEWISAVGERVLTLYPGPEENAEIPEGSYVEAASTQIEVDQVLKSLDAPTRKRMTSLIRRLNSTVEGREPELRRSIQEASSTVGALGEVLRAVGQDGPAIRTMVTDLSGLLKASAGRRAKISRTVADLAKVSEAVAAEQAAVSESLQELPSTLRVADATLAKVPATSEETKALLDELEPSTAQLEPVSRDLAPVLVDLRPTVAELRPLLSAADQLLGQTPALLDSSHEVLPESTGLIEDLTPAVAFLRPYTPEAVGGLHNWGQAFAPYDGAGHTWAGLLAPGANAFNENLVPLPTARHNPEPPPGQPAGQPWVDAAGSEVR